MHRRYLSDRFIDFDHYIGTAKAYTGKLTGDDIRWVHEKPYDQKSGHASFWDLIYPALNLIQAMTLPSNSKVLEVGAGTGWFSELLLRLGHHVDALEPSDYMSSLGRHRARSVSEQYGFDLSDRYRSISEPIETANLEKGYYNGIVFYDVLHHVIDEKATLSRCFEVLAPGGVLGIREGAWRPGDVFGERVLEEEMEKYGTLENPFTQIYLDRLLADAGFIANTRYISVNGYFPIDDAESNLAHVAAFAATAVNDLTARKPLSGADLNGEPSAFVEVHVIGKSEARRSIKVTLRLLNDGGTIWSALGFKKGGISIALRRGPVGSAEFIECLTRVPISRTLLPGQSDTLTAEFFVPADLSLNSWEIDLISEGNYWFSEAGRVIAPII